MKKTLEKYIDPANIPKKYGGELDFKFGMMPILEPAIEKAVIWEQQPTQDGRPTVPSGPIKWVESSDGTVRCIAVGTQGGKPRSEVIAALPGGMSLKSMYGDLVNVNTPVAESELNFYTTGTATHPHIDAVVAADQDAPPPDSGTPSPPSEPTPPTLTSQPTPTTTTTATSTNSQQPQQQQQKPALTTPDPADISSATQKASAMTLTDDNPPTGGKPPASDPVTTGPTDREGTSHTRMAEQSRTHAAGTLASGTPAVRDLGAGDRHVEMESATVGQAPKDVSEPVGAPAEAADPGVVAQAQEAVGQVVQRVKDAVGLGEKEEEKKDAKEGAKEDERVDGAGDAKVEEYLRAQVGSTAADAAK